MHDEEEKSPAIVAPSGSKLEFKVHDAEAMEKNWFERQFLDFKYSDKGAIAARAMGRTTVHHRVYTPFAVVSKYKYLDYKEQKLTVAECLFKVPGDPAVGNEQCVAGETMTVWLKIVNKTSTNWPQDYFLCVTNKSRDQIAEPVKISALKAFTKRKVEVKYTPHNDYVGTFDNKPEELTLSINTDDKSDKRIVGRVTKIKFNVLKNKK